MLIVAIFLAVTFFAAVLVSILLGTVWIHLLQLPSSSKHPIRQATTIILGDVNSFYYDQVYADIDEKSLSNVTRDLDFSIDIYGIQGACANIPSSNIYDVYTDVIVTDKNISNFVPIYALSGSYLYFQLYGKGSNSSSQNMFVKVCLNSGASYEDGTQLDCVKKDLFKSFGRYEIIDPGYYFFTVQSLDGITEYVMNVSGRIKKIHATTSEMLGCPLSRSNLSCHIPLSTGSNTYCLLAEFYKLPYHRMLTELNVKVEKARASFILGITLPPLLLLVLLIFSGFSVIVCIKCFCKYRTKRPWHVPLTYSI